MAGLEQDSKAGDGFPRGIKGFKQGDFEAATPTKVFGPDVTIDDLPEGIRLYIRGKAIDFNQKELIIRVYRLINEGGQKDEKEFVGRFRDRIPEDEDIAEQFGPGEYIWIAKWRNADGQERGMVSENVRVGEDMRPHHEKWLRERKGGAASTPAPPASPVAPQLPGFSSELQGFLAIQSAERANTMDMVKTIMALSKPNESKDSAGSVLKDAYETGATMLREAAQMSIDTIKKTGKRALRAAEDLDDAGDDDGDDEGDGAAAPSASDNPIPAWLQPYLSQVKPWLENLLGGGPTGAAVKTLILSTDEWKEIFKDKEKFSQAIAGMEKEFGSERTQKALDVLLNRRAEKPKAKNGKK